MKRLLALSTLTLLVGLASAQTSRIELRANLTGAGTGKAVWKTRDQGTHLEAQLESEGQRLRPNQAYRLNVGPRSWTVRTDATGAYRFALPFLGANRPVIVAGTRVVVLNSAGVIVLTGLFQ